jgi:hypothetical protein
MGIIPVLKAFFHRLKAAKALTTSIVTLWRLHIISALLSAIFHVIFQVLFYAENRASFPVKNREI